MGFKQELITELRYDVIVGLGIAAGASVFLTGIGLYGWLLRLVKRTCCSTTTELKN